MFESRQSAGDGSVISLDETNPLPKYQQIAEQIRTLAAMGRLRPGDKLPSIRQLASDLTVNINTVLAAYRALDVENVIILRHGSRATIHPRLGAQATPAPADLARIRALLERVRTDALLLGLSNTDLRALALEVFHAPTDGVSQSISSHEGQ